MIARIARTLAGAATWMVLVVLGVIIVALIVVPTALGWVPLTVLSGSMGPAIAAGSQVVVEPLDGEDDAAVLREGHVVAFMPYPDDSTLVIHRVVGVTATPESVVLTTQGDALDHPDAWDVTATQLRGVVRYHVPYAGYVATLLDGDQKRAVALTAVGVLGIYVVWQMAAGALNRRRRPPWVPRNSNT